MRTPRLFALIALSLAAGGILARSGMSLHAQSAAPAAPPAKTPEYVTYQSGTGLWQSATHTLELSQGVQFDQDDATLKTDAAVALLDKDQNLVSAKAEGPVHLYDPQDDLTGQHGTVDFTKHMATLRDSIVLVVKPGKREANATDTSPRKQFKDPATLTCAELTYDYRYKVGKIPGPLTVTQVIQTKDDGPQTRTLTADAGLYDGRAQTIQLLGDIKGTYSDGSIIQGDTRLKGKPVIIGIKEGSEYIKVPFPTIGHFPVKPQTDSGKNSSGKDDDGPDLTLPAVPPHTPGSGDSPAVPPAAPPAQTPPAPAPPTAPPVGSP